MLRNSRFSNKSYLCRENRFEKINDENQPEREDDPRDHHTQVTESHKYCGLS